MKKCEFCGMEISYFDQYCNEDCQREAIKFYDLRENYTKIFSVLNCIGIFMIPIGIFIFSFANEIGVGVVALGLLLLGITVMLLPFPTENMLSNRKIKKAVKITRIIGLIVFLLGIAVTITFLTLYIF